MNEEQLKDQKLARGVDGTDKIKIAPLFLVGLFLMVAVAVALGEEER